MFTLDILEAMLALVEGDLDSLRYNVLVIDKSVVFTDWFVRLAHFYSMSFLCVAFDLYEW